MAIQNATKGGLEMAATTIDSVQLMQKAAPQLLARVQIEGAEHKIHLPEGSRYLRTKSGHALIFDAMPGEKNHVVVVPEGAVFVQFPHYREHGDHIQYGNASFYYG